MIEWGGYDLMGYQADTMLYKEKLNILDDSGMDKSTLF